MARTYRKKGISPRRAEFDGGTWVRGPDVWLDKDFTPAPHRIARHDGVTAKIDCRSRGGGPTPGKAIRLTERGQIALGLEEFYVEVSDDREELWLEWWLDEQNEAVLETLPQRGYSAPCWVEPNDHMMSEWYDDYEYDSRAFGQIDPDGGWY